MLNIKFIIYDFLNRPDALMGMLKGILGLNNISYKATQSNVKQKQPPSVGLFFDQH